MSHVRCVWNWCCRVALLLLLVSVAHSTASSVAIQGQTCPGCAGSSATQTINCPESSLDHPAFVKVTVDMEAGLCSLQADVPGGATQCRPKSPCNVTITREWAGLVPNSYMKFCVRLGTRKDCKDPSPTSGASGSGAAVQGPFGIACGETPLNWSIQGTCNDTGAIVMAEVSAACQLCVQ